MIRVLDSNKEKVVKRFSTIREILSPKISILQRKLEECLATKTSYDKFSYTHLSMVEVASYALISIYDIVKENWKKEVERLKIVYVDCFSRISS